jgi:hypothetical protein
MADNDQDPAGSTQMFRAFVDEGAPSPQSRGTVQGGGGGRTGVIAIGVVIALVVIAAVVWLAVK